MQFATHRTLHTNTIAAEPEQPIHDNTGGSAEKYGTRLEQPNVAADHSNNLTNFNLARLLASCGDCV